MDVKIGYQLYEDNADPAKKEKMIKNAQGTTIETMGVRISGMKVKRRRKISMNTSPPC